MFFRGYHVTSGLLSHFITFLELTWLHVDFASAIPSVNLYTTYLLCVLVTMNVFGSSIGLNIGIHTVNKKR